ncbi:MAG: ComF family protein [Hyphomicrobiales bacterium]
MDYSSLQRDFTKLARQTLRTAADFLMPPKCQICQCDVERQGGVCAKCWATLDFLEHPRCSRTGIPFPYDPREGVESAAAIANPPAWNRTIGAVTFDAASRNLVHALKYRDRHEAAEIMATLMWRAGAELFSDAHMLAPVPLHHGRLWSRRYNQSALLAKRLGNKTGLKVAGDVLTRVKATRPQVGLSQSERKRNLRNAFTVSKSKLLELSGCRVILVDDVLTTGATAEACARVLYRYGAQRVDVLIFALVIRPESMSADDASSVVLQ